MQGTLAAGKTTITKGIAKAIANPNIPSRGLNVIPDDAASTSRVPIIGPVHENETITSVNAIKSIDNRPDVLSTCWSIFVLQVDGSAKSKPPKKDMENSTRRANKNMLKMAFVEREFNPSAPLSTVIIKPSPT